MRDAAAEAEEVGWTAVDARPSLSMAAAADAASGFIASTGGIRW